MKRVILFSVLLGICGLILGYFLFGKFAGEYVKVSTLISPPNNFFEDITQTVSGMKDMRQKILITGGGGVVLGVIISLFFRKR